MIIAECKDNDVSSIRDLFKIVFKQEITTEFWKWRFENNILDEKLISLMWEERILIGHYGACPIEFLIEDKKVKSALSLTTMTHPNYGGKGIFPTLAENLYGLMNERSYAFIYGFPNNNSHYSFIKKLKWNNICEIPTFSLSTSKLSMKENSLFKISKCDEFNFNQNHQKLFLEYTSAYNVKLNRSPEFLNWRYGKNPNNLYFVYEYYNSEGKLLAFAIIKVFNNNGNNICFRYN